MLFVAEYELTWDALEVVIAKRLEWEHAQPDGFRFVGEYVWQDYDPPFRGFAVIEVSDVEALNHFVLHYGPTLKLRLHPASDVVSAIRLAGPGGALASPARRRAAKKRPKPATARRR